MHRSVAVRAEKIAIPARLTEQQVQLGGSHVRENCIMCRVVSGTEPSDVAKGLNPEPPRLAKLASHRTKVELFWIVKNGIKMTGMPAFGLTHEDKDIWAIVAFVSSLPKLSPEEY